LGWLRHCTAIEHAASVARTMINTMSKQTLAEYYNTSSSKGHFNSLQYNDIRPWSADAKTR